MTKNNEQITIDEINTIGYVRSAIELARETLVEKDQLREYYEKQLLRKEQECEELTTKCSQLEEENNTYKSSIVANLDKNISKRYRELLEENDQLKETIDGLLSIQYKLADNCVKYSQTLEEIREIAEDTKDKFYDAIHTGGLYDRLEQIIRKINEVEGEKKM